MGEAGHGFAGTIALLAATLAALVASAIGHEEGSPAGAGLDAEAADAAPGLDADALLELGERRAPEVAARVERLRELRFDEPPKPRIADADDLQRIAERELAKRRVRRDVRVSEIELELVHLLGPGESLGDVLTDTTGLAAAYYDPERGRLFLVGDAVPAGPQVTEFVLAHELTHALEDQAFGLPKAGGVSDDASLARSALVEGSAQALMIDYAGAHLDPLALAAEAGGVDAGTGDIPRFAIAQVQFTYSRGMDFVQALRSQSADDWRLVDFAYRERPPETTEQIIHPEKYFDAEGALAVEPPEPPDGRMVRLDGGNLGEFVTAQILSEQIGPFAGEAAAEGWGGDSYRLWRVECPSGEAPSCGTEALAVRWRWDDEAEARELGGALGDTVARWPAATVVQPGVWRTAQGCSAVAREGDAVGLAIARGCDTARAAAALG